MVGVEALNFFSGFGLAAWIVLNHIAHSGDFASVLLLVYWTLNLPFIGQEIAEVAWQYPTLRNRTLRLLEPLSAPLDAQQDEGLTGAAALATKKKPAEETFTAVSAVFENVSVRLAGHMVLEEIDLELAAGSHVAIVGPSGAGKSSLLGLLLGWYRPAGGPNPG